MSFSSTRTYNIFTAGETAPTPSELAVVNPEDADTHQLIVNDFGNIALHFAGLLGNAVLDETVEPPVVRFTRSRLGFVFGDTAETGLFVAGKGPLDRGVTYVSGVYNGPASKLKVTL